jgi:hypothetical protein
MLPAVAAPAPARACLPCAASGGARPAVPPGGDGRDGWLPLNRHLSPQSARGPAGGLGALEPSLRALAETTVFFILAPADVRRELALSTWAAGLPHVAFVGDATCAACDVRVELGEKDSWGLLPNKNFLAWPKLLAAYPSAERFVKVDTDGYLIAPNLFEALALHAAVAGAEPDYMGHVFTWPPPADYAPEPQPPANCDQPIAYASGGAGYVVSRRAATVMATSCTLDQSQGMEDILVGRCLCRAGITPVHHAGFLAEPVPAALHSWLVAPIFPNHHPDAAVPAAIIAVHGYKKELDFLALDALVRAKDASSLRHLRAADGGAGRGRTPTDTRALWDVCCSEHP